MNAIEVKNLSKSYALHLSTKEFLREILTGRRRSGEEVVALHDISFSVEKGHTVGIVGPNGSGKSTLLQLICGIARQTAGELNVDGRISALLELGAGFSPECTGRDNVYMVGALQGFSRREMSSRMKEIEEFAEIGPFMDQPVKTYSSGMFLRLAFATGITVDPDILIVDEVLAVGDIYFQHKCMMHLAKFQQRGKTVVFVSHDVGQVKALCDQALYLREGELIRQGPAGEVVDQYVLDIAQDKAGRRQGRLTTESDEESEEKKVVCEEVEGGAVSSNNLEASYLGRGGSGEVKVSSIQILNEAGQPVSSVAFGDRLFLEITATALEPCSQVTVAFYVKTLTRIEAIGSNTDYDGANLIDVSAGETFSVRFGFDARFRDGMYSGSVILAEGPGVPEYYDWIEGAFSFEVQRALNPRYALYTPAIKTEVTRSARKAQGAG